MICVVIEGEFTIFSSLIDYLSENPPVPVVVCDGTGRAADIISFAHRLYDERKSFPDSIKNELISTMQIAFTVSREIAEKLFRELMVCFQVGYEYISIYSFGSQADGSAEVDVKILSALLKVHSESALEQFKLTVKWNRPDLAESQIFRIGKVRIDSYII